MTSASILDIEVAKIVSDEGGEGQGGFWEEVMLSTLQTVNQVSCPRSSVVQPRLASSHIPREAASVMADRLLSLHADSSARCLPVRLEGSADGWLASCYLAEQPHISPHISCPQAPHMM